MRVKDIILNSGIEVNDDHTVVDCNAVPAKANGKRPALVFADDFVKMYGELDAEPIRMSDIGDADTPEGTARMDYEWYRADGIVFGVFDGPTYDVVFNDDEDSNAAGLNGSYDLCRDYIEQNNGTDYGYFEDYKGGTVGIICNDEDAGEIYSEAVR